MENRELDLWTRGRCGAVYGSECRSLCRKVALTPERRYPSDSSTSVVSTVATILSVGTVGAQRDHVLAATANSWFVTLPSI